MVMSCGWLSRRPPGVIRIKTRFGAQRIQIFRANVAHPGSKAAKQLEDHVAESATIRDARFDTFSDHLAAGVLPVTVARASSHRLDRSHSAILLKRPPLMLNHRAWAFFRASQKRT